LDQVFHEIDALDSFRKRVEKAIESIQEPLHIAQTCLANRYYQKVTLKLLNHNIILKFSTREKRYDIDLVHDNVQKELIKEVEIEKGCDSLLVRLLEQVNEQLRLNRKAKYNLESDLKNKFSALSIDSHVQNLSLTNPTTYLKNGTAKIEPKYLFVL
jgi:tektin-1